MLESLLQELRYSMRQLRRSPLWTVAVLSTLGLAIGTNVLIFGLFNACFLSPLGFRHEDRIVRVFEAFPDMGRYQINTSLPIYRYWEENNQVFDRISLIAHQKFVLGGGAEPVEISANRVSPGFFDLLGVNLLVGRGFREDDLASGEKVAILSFGLWKSLFGGSSSIVGTSIQLDAEKHLVIGVAPQGVAYPPETDLWLPPYFPYEHFEQRDRYFLSAIARIRPDGSLGEARAEMELLARQLEQAYPELQKGRTSSLIPIREHLFGSVRGTLYLLLASSALMLLIACANVGNLSLARAAARAPEMALRLYLGAGRWRLVRQVAAEHVLLAWGGGLVGFALAWLGSGALHSWMTLSRVEVHAIPLDWRVFSFCMVLSVLTGFLISSAPAYQETRTNWQRMNIGPAFETFGSGVRMRSIFVAGGICISLILLVATGLMLRSLSLRLPQDPGFPVDGLIAINVSLPKYRYSEKHQQQQFTQSLLKALEESPLELVSAVQPLPFRQTYRRSVQTQKGEVVASYRLVASGFFATLGLRLLQGRDFTWDDRKDTPPVAIINQALAESLDLPHHLGQQVAERTLVGVVENIRYSGLNRDFPEMYIPFLQEPSRSVSFLARTSLSREAVEELARAQIWAIDPNLPVAGAVPMNEIMPAATKRRGVLAQILGTSAGLALFLAVIGVFSMLSYMVNQRRHEIGVRIALGASSSDVFRWVFKRGLKLTLAGMAAGLVGSLAATRWLASWLYGVTPTDVPTLISASLLLTVAALSASCWPAFRAMRADPGVALRAQ